MTLNPGHLSEKWAKLLIKELIHQGVRYFCISPGLRSAPLIFAVKEHPLAKTFVHFDERGMAFHALGYAKASRLPVALIVTSGTALGNILPAIMEADSDEIPLIVLTADRPPELRRCGANQTTNQVKIYTNFVRHEVDLPCPSLSICTRFIGTTIAESVSFALKAPKGPVHINCMFREPFFQEHPEEELSSDFPHNAQTTLALGKISLSVQEVEGFAEDLIEHEKGIILVGQMEPWETLEPLLKLSRFLQWPIFPNILSEIRSLGKANGVIPGFDLILKTIGMNEDLSPNVILQFGDRFVSKKLMQWLALTKPKLYAHVATHTNRKDPIHAITHRIHSDPFTFCKELTNQIIGKAPSSWMKFWTDCSDKTEQVVNLYLKQQKKLTEANIFQLLPSSLLKHSGLFLSNSMPIRSAESFFYPEEPIGPIFGNRGLSGIDGNIATAIGIAAGLEKPVIAILGDLSFLHDMSSLAQLKNSPFPISFLVINNNGGSIFSFLPSKKCQNSILPILQNPHNLDIRHIAPLFKLTYENPKSLSELKHILKKTVSNSYLIEVETESEDNFKIHEEIVAHIKEMQASASFKLSNC